LPDHARIKLATVPENLFRELLLSVREKMIHRTPGSLGFAGQLLETGAGVTLGAKQSFARAQQSIPGLRHQAVILFAVGPAPIESAATPFPDVSQGSPNKSRHRRKNVLIYTVRGLVDPQRRDDQQAAASFHLRLCHATAVRSST
jgi:hypothetical protein